MRKIKLIKQHDEKDCGVACLSMVLNFFDTSVPISKLRLMSGTNSQGTSAFGLVQALNNFQFQTDGSIWKEKDLPYPLIAQVIIDGAFFHYVVVYGMKNGKLLLADPAKGKIERTPEEFASIWTGILLITAPTENYHPIQDKSNGLFSFVPLLASHKKTIAGIVLLSFMNLMMHGINYRNMNLKRGDTLNEDWPFAEKDGTKTHKVSLFSKR